jgi:hypothetical protein
MDAAVPKPSTDWREQIAADEDERYARYAEQVTAMQARRNRRYGQGRGLHRKPVLALHARLQVLPQLPDFARHGLFALPGARYDALVRLSNGGPDRLADRKPDIRGFAVKVLGVDGPAAMGEGRVTSQSLLLINHATFGLRDSAEFMDLLAAFERGPLALFGHLLKVHGPLGALGKMKETVAKMAKPFAGFACESFHSAAPIACGPYAARVRLQPVDPPAARRGARDDWAADFRAQLSARPLVYRLQLQFFVDERSTPIEDGTVDWDEARAPYHDVAELRIEQQPLEGAAFDALQRRAEAEVFDPWVALAAHRPLGDIMRARKATYFASQKGRGAA